MGRRPGRREQSKNWVLFGLDRGVRPYRYGYYISEKGYCRNPLVKSHRTQCSRIFRFAFYNYSLDRKREPCFENKSFFLIRFSLRKTTSKMIGTKIFGQNEGEIAHFLNLKGPELIGLDF